MDAPLEIKTSVNILQEIAKRLSYKPGHFFFVREPVDGQVVISLRCPALNDSNSADGLAGLTINNTIDLKRIRSTGDAVACFANLVSDFELHEAAEFFRLDDSRVFLPHGWTEAEDDTNNFSWKAFRNLHGKFLYAFKKCVGSD